MKEYAIVRASEILGQDELVVFLKSRFGKTVRARPLKGASLETVEVRVPPQSREFDEIRQFIEAKRSEGINGFELPIGRYSRQYSLADLRRAEILRLTIGPHFDSPGLEFGTVYETLCRYCNLALQVSDLTLDLRRVPKHKDISETIARTEWVVSSKFEQAFLQNKLTGAEFRRVFDRRNPATESTDWRQLWITGRAGPLAPATKLGRDPFQPDHVSWRCPLGHTVVTQFLSEIFLSRNTWVGGDIGLTSDLFGQGRGFIRPMPLIIISQRMYRAIEEAGLKGASYEVAHLI